MSSTIDYSGGEAEHKHTFAEAKVRVVNPSSGVLKYNFQLAAWSQPGTLPGVGSVIKHYDAKLIWGARGCSTDPALILTRLPELYNDTKCELVSGVLTPKPTGVFCQNDPANNLPPPPLHVPDPQYPGLSKPVWIRIEVNLGVGNLPIITGTVGWGACDDAVGALSCEHTCSAQWTDDDPDFGMTQPGSWGLGFHEFDYTIRRIYAGSESGP